MVLYYDSTFRLCLVTCCLSIVLPSHLGYYIYYVLNCGFCYPPAATTLKLCWFAAAEIDVTRTKFSTGSVRTSLQPYVSDHRIFRVCPTTRRTYVWDLIRIRYIHQQERPVDVRFADYRSYMRYAWSPVDMYRYVQLGRRLFQTTDHPRRRRGKTKRSKTPKRIIDLARSILKY